MTVIYGLYSMDYTLKWGGMRVFYVGSVWGNPFRADRDEKYRRKILAKIMRIHYAQPDVGIVLLDFNTNLALTVD